MDTLIKSSPKRNLTKNTVLYNTPQWAPNQPIFTYEILILFDLYPRRYSVGRKCKSTPWTSTFETTSSLNDTCYRWPGTVLIQVYTMLKFEQRSLGKNCVYVVLSYYNVRRLRHATEDTTHPDDFQPRSLHGREGANAQNGGIGKIPSQHSWTRVGRDIITLLWRSIRSSDLVQG